MKPFLERFCPAAAAAGRPAVMGIVNATPDSFSDGGAHATPEAAVAWARGLVAAGAPMLRWYVAGSVFAGIVMLSTCLCQASGRALPGDVHAEYVITDIRQCVEIALR